MHEKVSYPRFVKRVLQLALLSANANRLMDAAKLSNAAIEKKTDGRLRRSTLDRLRRAGGNTGVEVLDELAKVFSLEIWQLFIKDLTPPTHRDWPGQYLFG